MELDIFHEKKLSKNYGFCEGTYNIIGFGRSFIVVGLWETSLF
jgi:hypothetical protein